MKKTPLALRILPAWVFVLVSVLPQLLNAQTRYALNAYQGCWGEVSADPAFAPDTAWTGEAWIYLQDDLTSEQIVFETQHPLANFVLVIAAGRPQIIVTFDELLQLEASSSLPAPLGAWTHLAATYEADGLRLFMNGQERAFSAGVGASCQTSGPICLGGDGISGQLSGWVDEVRLSDTVRYSSAAGGFDPFNVPLADLRVGDQVVTGWDLGTNPGDLMQAWDYQSLYDIIDGMAEIYIAHNFQYFLQQYYYGQIGGHNVRLTLWMFDQGTPEDAEALYHDPFIAPFFFLPIDSVGSEARVDTTLLFDWALDFWRDKYYVKITLSKEYGAAEALQVVLNFGAQADTNILERDLFQSDEHTVALWHFDEGWGSTFADASGNGHNGNLQNPSWAATAPYAEVFYIASARLEEGIIQTAAIDEDDTALVAFSEPAANLTITAANIDEVLTLSGGHSWLSGDGSLGSALWDQNRDTLKITFALSGGSPSIADDDTVRPNPLYLQSRDSLSAGGYRFVRFEGIAGVTAGQIAPLPARSRLLPLFPTPFNSDLKIGYELERAGEVSLRLYDISGRETAVISQGRKNAGFHQVTWNAQNLPAGIYLIALESGGARQIQKAVLVK